MTNTQKKIENHVWHQFDSPESLAQTLAENIVTQINAALANNNKAVLAFSGGGTPKPLFSALAEQEIDWAKVIITLVDERWVPIDNELSNARFLQQNLLSKLDTQPKFVPLYQASTSVESSLTLVEKKFLSTLDITNLEELEFDVVVLGMGDDGHTASFFPDADKVADLVDPHNKLALLHCESPSTQVPRVTWSVPALLKTNYLVLHIVGDTKKRVFQQALLNDDALELPIRSMLFQDKQPLNVFHSK